MPPFAMVVVVEASKPDVAHTMASAALREELGEDAVPYVGTPVEVPKASEYDSFSLAAGVKAATTPRRTSRSFDEKRAAMARVPGQSPAPKKKGGKR